MSVNTHPKALKIFFATEMWERYGFYVVQTLLALYLSIHMHWQDERIYSLVGSFTALTYLWPIVGGFIADNYIGQRLSVLAGCLILFLSYVGLAISDESNIIFCLASIAIGTGLLKPNISSLLGNEYSANSSQREKGFTIFYMGITTGIILGTTLPSYICHYFGWHGAFVSASLGMIIAACIFIYGIYRYKLRDYSVHDIQIKKIFKAIILLLSFWAVACVILYCPQFANIAFIVVVIISLSYLLYRIKVDTKKQALRNIIILLLCVISTMFWAFYFQMFLSLTLFIARLVKPQFLGIDFPAPYYVAIQSFGMIIFGLWFANKATLHDNIKVKLDSYVVITVGKFFISMLSLTGAYFIINVVCRMSLPISPIFIIPAYLLISIAELLLSPVGLSAMTVLAARNKVSTMMGIFFVSLGIGAYLAGKLANFTAVPAENLSRILLKQYYTVGFMKVFIILIATTLASYILYSLVKKHQHNFN